VTDDSQTPAVPLAAANGVEEAGQPAPSVSEDPTPTTPAAYRVTCLFCGQRHEYGADQVEAVPAEQDA
jgi:hypothetical protein